MQRSNRGAARLQTVLTLLFAVTAVSLVAERLGYAGAYAGRASLTAIAEQGLLGLPAAVQLCALWQLRQAVAQTAAGLPFAQSAARGLRRAGVLLIVAAGLTMLVGPMLHHLLDKPYPRLIEFDISTLIVGAIGAALTLVARSLDLARTVQHELDEIF